MSIQIYDNYNIDNKETNLLFSNKSALYVYIFINNPNIFIHVCTQGEELWFMRPDKILTNAMTKKKKMCFSERGSKSLFLMVAHIMNS